MELSIDTGNGSTKFMGKFVRNGGGQSVTNVLLLAEAHSIRETFDALFEVFGDFSKEIANVASSGITIDGEKYHVKFYFVGDYKVYGALLVMKTAQSTYSCPWCRTPRSRMDQDLQNLSGNAN